MKARTVTREQALQLIYDYELDFLDLCRLVTAYAERIDGGLKIESPRVNVHIKTPEGERRVWAKLERENREKGRNG